MPSVEQNVSKWGDDHSWIESGNEWSGPWGSPANQWRGAILPRIAPYLPARTILEIAPGFGRWTQFLREHCERLIGVDLNANCIERCRERFHGDPMMSFHQNDGSSLAVAADESVDFVFSFDSLVHAEAGVIDAYLAEIKRILTPQGIAFIHHSNFADHLASPAATMLTHIPKIRVLMWRTRAFGVKPNHHWRAESVSARVVRDLVKKNGLHCVRQELVNWSVDFLNDCFTTVSRAPLSECVVIENLDFMKEAEAVRQSSI